MPNGAKNLCISGICLRLCSLHFWLLQFKSDWLKRYYSKFGDSTFGAIYYQINYILSLKEEQILTLVYVIWVLNYVCPK